MWTGVSGLIAHGEKMNVLGNNIANVNTVGYKGSTMHFEDFISQTVSTTGANFGQVGRGVSVSAIYADHSQGAFETTNEATDLAIGGNGFFAVKVPDGEDTYYTRAGNFRFNEDGYLVDPHGYVLQGWQIEDASSTESLLETSSGTSSTDRTSSIRGTGVPTDIRLDGFTASPRHTQQVTMITNLDADGGNNSTASTGESPFLGLFHKWDGTAATPLADSAYAYQSTIKVYDEGGTSHNLSVYFDQVSDAGDNKTYWEYIVTMDPSEDNRTFWDSNSGASVSVAGTSGAGLLMAGTLTFNSSGLLEDVSAFSLQSDAGNTAALISGGGASTGGFKDVWNWGATAISQDGYPLLTANFTGQSNSSFVIDGSNTRVASSNYPNTQAIEINFGIASTTDTWDSNGTTTLSGVNAVNGSAFTSTSVGSYMPTMGNTTDVQSLATTSFDGASSTLYQTQDGYTFGFLQNVTVDRDGIMSGRYSNGETIDLYQVTLYNFTNPTGLFREGGNLFSQTKDSGEALQGPANANGLGSITSNSLEQSNVDLAREFVSMITTQRGFQANSKVITTTDSMLQEVIMLKR
jgi:flagellar hook protein FlgE